MGLYCKKREEGPPSPDGRARALGYADFSSLETLAKAQKEKGKAQRLMERRLKEEKEAYQNAVSEQNKAQQALLQKVYPLGYSGGIDGLTRYLSEVSSALVKAEAKREGMRFLISQKESVLKGREEGKLPLPRGESGV